MSFISSIHTRYLAWSHSTPLPNLPDTGLPVFQHWHIFDKATAMWVIARPGTLNARGHTNDSSAQKATENLRLLTWNIDAFGEQHEHRMGGILSKLQQMGANGSGPNVVFFQEVSRKALSYLLHNAWFRDH